MESMRMEANIKENQDHHSMFETSHVLGALLASSPLLSQSWSCCERVNTNTSTFIVNTFHDTVYVAFSSPHSTELSSTTVNAFASCFFRPAPIETDKVGPFSTLLRGVDDGEDDGDEQAVLVQAGALHLFQSLYKTNEFKMLSSEMRNKKVVFTGHSTGGNLAVLVALYFLCSSRDQTSSSTDSLLCITFGSPLLGNEALSRAILRERWSGKFCHVVAQYDIVPRLLFCPLSSMSTEFIMLSSTLMNSLQSLTKYSKFSRPALHLSEQQRAEIRLFVSMHMNLYRELSTEMPRDALYRPFGNYALCSTEGAVCIDEPHSLTKMLYLTFVSGSSTLSIEEEHLCYGELVGKLAHNLLIKKGIPVEEDAFSTSTYNAGVLLALEASGIKVQDMGATEAKECFEMSRRIGGRPNIMCANLSVKLAKVTPCRAQIEWYKALSDDETGYYDCFKLRRAPKRDGKVNMNRIKLAQFWNGLMDMLQNNELPHDFHKRNKWVNAAHFYKLLVEPLDIAEYYRLRMHKRKGHYRTHGRERRYEVFDRWWTESQKEFSDNGKWKRSKFAGLTQDSCFWARVEEAKELIEGVGSENEPAKISIVLEGLRGFDEYAKELIERKEVSRDVLAPQSSYSVWNEQWNNMRLGYNL